MMEKRMDELREVSGAVTYADPLTTLFYLLIRDHVPAGVVEKIVWEVANDPEEIVFTNGWLAKYANNLSEQLTGAKTVQLKSALEKVFNETEEVRSVRAKREEEEEKLEQIKKGMKKLGEAGMDDSVLAELEGKLKEACNLPVDTEESSNPVDDVIDEAQSSLELMKESGLLSEEDVKRIQTELDETAKEVHSQSKETQVVTKSPEEMAEVAGLTEEDQKFAKEDVLSKAKEAEETQEKKEPASVFPPPPGLVDNRWQNTMAELDKQQDEE